MKYTLGLLRTLFARQMAIENILIEHNLTTNDEIESLADRYYERENIANLIKKIKDEFGDITRWQLINFLDSKLENDNTPKEDTK